ncbi:toprim domain-containing protein [Vibrio crassostreae]|uniref:toprim domain-containing protein n=1 Tax=Vibrio crassostreae TaxID=246167 RepID=UPI001B308F73|nr:toprim domain-containing protein [Vibrio crassostreae]
MQNLSKQRDFEAEDAKLRTDLENYGWDRVFAYLTPLKDALSVNSHGSKKSDVCPLADHKTKGFRLIRDWKMNGSCRCYNCGEFFDGFKVIMEFNGWDFKKTIVECKNLVYGEGGWPKIFKDKTIVYGSGAKEVLKEKPVYTLKREKTKEEVEAEEKESKRIRESNNTLWSMAYPTEHPISEPGQLYFQKRGISSYHNLTDSMRFHPSVRYTHYASIEEVELIAYLRSHESYVKEWPQKDGGIVFDLGYHPCMLFIMRHPEDYRACAIQRIYITKNGEKLYFDPKYKLSIKKRTESDPLNSATGSACLFGPVGAPVIGVAEGPETTLAVLTGLGMPLHSTIDANGLKEYLAKMGTYVVVIFADKDRSKTGEIAARELAERLDKEKVNVYVVMPPLDIPEGEKSVDWNDAWQKLGIDAFPEEIQNWIELAA